MSSFFPEVNNYQAFLTTSLEIRQIRSKTEVETRIEHADGEHRVARPGVRRNEVMSADWLGIWLMTAPLGWLSETRELRSHEPSSYVLLRMDTSPA